MKRIAMVLIGLGAATVAVADAELVLQDGQTLRGVDVRRVGDQYLLELESGDVLTLPASLVRGLNLTGDDTRPPSGLVDAGSEELTEVPVDEKRGPTGLRRGDPETLVGEPVKPPRTSEQLEVFGEASRFRKSLVNRDWVPRSAWDAGYDVMERGRSDWQLNIVQPDWTPDSAFDAAADVLKAGRSRWRENIIDPFWKPSDGFHPWRARD